MINDDNNDNYPPGLWVTVGLLFLIFIIVLIVARIMKILMV